MDWDKYRYFEKSEFDCKETGENKMQDAFISRLSKLREAYGKPMKITSGYRSANHGIEKRKAQPGKHTQGIAADIYATGADKYRIARLAFAQGFSGVGIGKNFIHVDISKERFAVWGY